ncbi:MAG: globin domain-containing protein [Hyphomonadaceae bacterium]
MEQHQVDLVQRSFARAAKVAPHVAATFYRELFALDPSLRAIFKGDMLAQGEKLMTMLAQIVDGLHEPDTFLLAVRELAVRHVSYGVEAHHYDLVGVALLRTLRHELGAEFTSETRAAWVEAYNVLASVMCEAAYERPAHRLTT